MRTSAKCLSTLAAALMVATLAHAADDKEHKDEKKAKPPKHGIAVLAPTKDYKVSGTLKLTQEKGYIHVTGEVSGLTPGLHGFHIHEFGDLSDPAGMSAGGHYNPDGQPHGGPHDEKRHGGDLGNIEADSSGVAKVDVKAEGLKIREVLGRAFVVHAKADDLKSQPAGDAGPRAALGIIGIAQVKPPATAAK